MTFIHYTKSNVLKNIGNIRFNNFIHLKIFWIFVSDGNYELFRDQVELGEIIGEGQFGDVHKGVCHMRSTKNTPGNAVAVAIKTCKPDADMATTNKFLEEACTYLYT